MPASTLQSDRRLRHRILAYLYACFQQYPLAAIELSELAGDCNASAQELNWNIVYLEKKGWVRLNFSSECQPFVACSVELTGAGIDLVEDPDAMDKLLGGTFQIV